MAGTMLTKKDLALELNVSTRTINRWLAARAIKAVRRGNVLRFDREEVERFKRKNSA